MTRSLRTETDALYEVMADEIERTALAGGNWNSLGASFRFHNSAPISKICRQTFLHAPPPFSLAFHSNCSFSSDLFVCCWNVVCWLGQFERLSSPHSVEYLVSPCWGVVQQQNYSVRSLEIRVEVSFIGKSSSY